MLFLLLFFSISAHAESSINGRVYTDQYIFTNGSPSGEIAQSSLSSWLEYDFQTEEQNHKKFGLHVVGQGDVFYRDLNHPHETSARARLREGYLSYTTDETVLRAGQQIIPWGKSDGINPTDYFTAKDFTLFNPDDEVKRMGAPGVSWNFTPDGGASPFNIQAVFQAYYPQTRLLIPDQVIPTGVAFSKYPNTPEAFSSNSMEFGFKVSYLKSNYDFSFSYFQGYSRFSQYVYESAANRIAPINPRESAVGGDASFTFAEYVVRIESALILPENGTDTDVLFGLVEPSHWDTVAGVERTFNDDFRVQVQGMIRHHLYYRDPNAYIGGSALVNTLQRAIGRANALILNYQQQTNLGATFRVGYANSSSNWTVDLFWVGYFSNGQDYLVRPQIGYKPMDNVRLVAGADLYGGQAERPLGALKDRSVGFFEAKYSF